MHMVDISLVRIWSIGMPWRAITIWQMAIVCSRL